MKFQVSFTLAVAMLIPVCCSAQYRIAGGPGINQPYNSAVAPNFAPTPVFNAPAHSFNAPAPAFNAPAPAFNGGFGLSLIHI